MTFRVLYIWLIMVIMSIRSWFKHHYILPGLPLISKNHARLNRNYDLLYTPKHRDNKFNMQLSVCICPRSRRTNYAIQCFLVFFIKLIFFHIYFRLLWVTLCNNKKFGVILLHCNSLMVRVLVHFVWNLYKHLLFGWPSDYFFVLYSWN